MVASNQPRRSSSASAWRTVATDGLCRRRGSITGLIPPYDFTVSHSPRKWMGHGRWPWRSTNARAAPAPEPSWCAYSPANSGHASANRAAAAPGSAVAGRP